MALLTQPVIGDTGSQEVALMREALNALTTAFVASQAGTAGAADFAAFKIASAAVNVSALRLVVLTKNIPIGKKFPTK